MLRLGLTALAFASACTGTSSEPAASEALVSTCEAPSFEGAASVEFPDTFALEPRAPEWAAARERRLTTAFADLEVVEVDCRCRHCRVVLACDGLADCGSDMRAAQGKRSSLPGLSSMMFSTLRPEARPAGAFVHAYLRF